MARLSKDEAEDFALYLKQRTDNQVQGVYEKEKRNNHRQEVRLAELEAARRGIQL